MQHQSPPQFFLSMESDCPYIKGNRERKLFTTLTKDNPQHTQNVLSHIGFRRSQNIIYRPACANCSGCVSARVPANEYKMRSSQKRIISKNKHIVREVRQCSPTDEQYDIFQKYVSTRHENGGMSDMTLEEFQAMMEEPLVSARIIEYRQIENGRPGKLIGACLTDVINDGISMVYSFFDPEYDRLSFGTYMILDHIQLCIKAHLDFVYLGYWIKDAPNMKYKANFAPLDLYVDEKWKRYDKPNEAASQHVEAQSILLSAHRKLARTAK